MNTIFSNGTEYHEFLNDQCAGCPHYVDWEQATEEKPVCEVEDRIAVANRETFPYEWLDENGYMHRYDCRKKAGLGPKEKNE